MRACGSACHAACVSPLVDSSGRSMRTPFSNFAPALTSATRWAELAARQRCCADSMSLKAIAIPAAREPGPLVTRYRSRTVAKVESIGLVVRKWIQCSLGKPANVFVACSAWSQSAAL